MTLPRRAETAIPGSRPHWIRRLSEVVPDFITAGLCLAVWIVPERFDSGFVTTMMLVMVVEFLVIHATIMVPILAALVPQRLGGVYSGLLAGSLFYLAFAAGGSLAIDSWWPTLAFGWLLASRYLFPLLGRGSDDDEDIRLWIFSTFMWLLLVFATLLLPIPDLGFHTNIAQALGGSASGIWIDEPHRALAFALLYFTSLALFKLRSQNRTAAVPLRLRSGVTAQERQQTRLAGKAALESRIKRLKTRRQMGSGTEKSDTK
ncbi:MAG: hypothetical protein ABW092_06245 [Candidatus Thiodiazotropha sp.]